uniref:Portal protein n=1 Tax=Dulem virus 36 TaxID=3145754 RepID=A0AAU8AYI7_9CAUD
MDDGVLRIVTVPEYPWFVLNMEKVEGRNSYISEIRKIKRYYIDYDRGAEFHPEGSRGDYVPSDLRFRICKTLIDKEARFMFSQKPDIFVKAKDTSEILETQANEYQKLVDKVLKRCNLPKLLLQSARDCFIGKRVACLVDFSEIDGIQIHFYNSLQFYYETDYGSDRLTKFISFEQVNRAVAISERKFLVNRYEEQNKRIHFSSVLYDGAGNVLKVLIPNTILQLDYIPAVVIVNDGTLAKKYGVSEMDIAYYESVYSKLANADIDSEGKGMNPTRYTVDMDYRSTTNLPSGPGAYWDLQHNQNVNDPKPSVGTLAPQLNHVEAVKTTLERIKSTMYNEFDIPDISSETLAGVITSGKTLNALYYPLKVRCDEKLATWKPALEFVIETILELAFLNEAQVKGMYAITDLKRIQFDVIVEENYALADDEQEEKDSDINEINAMARSRKSYLMKWRRDELNTDEKIEAELMQIAIEQNMFDTLSMNTSVQNAMQDESETQQVESNVEDVNIGLGE